MSDCLLWLIILPFRRVSHCIQRRGRFQTPRAWWSAAFAVWVCGSFPISAPYFLHCCSFPPPVCLPCSQTHVNTRSTCWDQTCWALHGERPLEKSVCHPWGCVPNRSLNIWDSQAAEGLIMQPPPVSWRRLQEVRLPWKVLSGMRMEVVVGLRGNVWCLLFQFPHHIVSFKVRSQQLWVNYTNNIVKIGTTFSLNTYSMNNSTMNIRSVQRTMRKLL